MSSDEKFNLITKNLQEVLGEEDLKVLLSKRNMKVYWGTATTGRIHVAYFLPILKIRDFLAADCTVKILLANVHAFLDNLKSSVDEIGDRTAYYEVAISAMLKRLGVDLSKITFVKGDTYQTSPKYTLDMFKIFTVTTGHDALKAGTQVVKQIENPMLSSMVYPSMQALDEEYLDVDAQLGGVDQRKIFAYARKHLPLIGYNKRIHLMNPMMPGLNCDKMSSSDDSSKIDILDTDASIKKKVRKCFCEPGNTNTGLLPLLRMIIFPIYEILGEEIEIVNKDGSCKKYMSYDEVESDFANLTLHPGDLKNNIARMMSVIIDPIRKDMEQHADLVSRAYGRK